MFPSSTEHQLVVTTMACCKGSHNRHSHRSEYSSLILMGWRNPKVTWWLLQTMDMPAYSPGILCEKCLFASYCQDVVEQERKVGHVPPGTRKTALIAGERQNRQQGARICCADVCACGSSVGHAAPGEGNLSEEYLWHLMKPVA